MKASVQPELAHSIHQYLQTHQDQMLAMLEVLVRAESPTDVPEAQADVQDALSRLLHTLDFTVQYLPNGDTCGGHLLAQPIDRPRGRPLAGGGPGSTPSPSSHGQRVRPARNQRPGPRTPTTPTGHNSL